MNDRLTDEQLAAIKARCDAATPGPWAWWAGDSPTHYLDDFAGGTILACDHFQDNWNEADAAFIAAARADVPALVAEVERLRAEAAKFDKLLSYYADLWEY